MNIFKNLSSLVIGWVERIVKAEPYRSPLDNTDFFLGCAGTVPRPANISVEKIEKIKKMVRERERAQNEPSMIIDQRGKYCFDNKLQNDQIINPFEHYGFRDCILEDVESDDDLDNYEVR